MRNGRCRPRFAPLVIELPHPALHLHRHHHASLGVLLHALGLRIAEEQQHGVADELVDGGAVFERDPRHFRQVVVENVRKLLELQVVGGLGEGGDVGEEDRQLLTLGRNLDGLRATEDRPINLRRQVLRQLRRQGLQGLVPLADQGVRLLGPPLRLQQLLLHALQVGDVGHHRHRAAAGDQAAANAVDATVGRSILERLAGGRECAGFRRGGRRWPRHRLRRSNRARPGNGASSDRAARVGVTRQARDTSP